MTDKVADIPLRLSPLDGEHRRLGAKMTAFGGWDMPLVYTSTLDEHRACRDAAVVFDVSHLGTLLVSGPGAFDCLQVTLTNDLTRVKPGRAQYTHLLDEQDAHVVDDIIVWWLHDDEFLVMPNASNTHRLTDALRAHDLDHETTITDVTATRAVVALQGPRARSLAAKIHPAFGSVARFGVAVVQWDDVACVVAGTGYTGEDGVEVQVPATSAVSMWEAIIAAGFQPAGLGARDTLRLEAGLPLHGHDLGPGITPLDAGLHWVVGWDNPAFRGRQALAAHQGRGSQRVLVGLAIEGRQPPRAHSSVVVDGAVVGMVTSGNFSPVLGCGIAMAYVDASKARDETTEFHLDIRGRTVPARRVALPFVSGRRT